MSYAIVGEHVGKQLRRASKDRASSVQEALTTRLFDLGRGKETTFWALRDVSFNVPTGTSLGLIGANGAGKSTLMRLIGHVGRPTEGTITTDGRIGGLLELGSGFEHDLTGRENVFINGVISGLSRRQVRERFDEIVDFAELDYAIDSPLRTYSSGMYMRLAFSIAIHSDPRILLIDEVLAVGDVAFQNKCRQKILDYKQAGASLVIVSHEMEMITEMCEQAIWLRNGTVAKMGRPESVVAAYLQHMGEEGETDDEDEGDDESESYTHEVVVTGVRLLSTRGESIKRIESGDPLCIEVQYKARDTSYTPRFLVSIMSEKDTPLCTLSSDDGELPRRRITGEGAVVAQVTRLDLTEGIYYIDVGIYQEDWSQTFDYKYHARKLIVGESSDEEGKMHPPTKWRFSSRPR